MMEMEVDDATVVPADGAASPRFLDQQPFHLLLAACHGFANATLATPSQSSILVAGVPPELG
jgi:hypothetical protein